ncbi:MAG TPA: hypothetical protein VIF62_31575 [Labilithrix sp.]
MAPPNPYAAPTAPSAATAEQSPYATARRDGYWALGLALLSLVFCAPISAPFAIWKAVRALRVDSSGAAPIAIVIAIVGLLSSAFFWFITIWQFLSPGPVH